MELLRYIRLGTRWSASKWVEPLNPGGRLAWVEMLCYVKAHGVAGRVAAMSNARAAREWNIPEVDVSAMLTAASLDGALVLDGSSWLVTNWPMYQEDSTAAERNRRYRAEKSRLSPLRHVTDNDVTQRRVTDVTVEKRREEKRKKEKPSADKRRVDQEEAWSTKAGDDWVVVFGGTANFGAIGKHIKPLVGRYGATEVLDAWSKYLRSPKVENQYKSPAAFAQKYSEWRNGKAANSANALTDKLIRERLA